MNTNIENPNKPQSKEKQKGKLRSTIRRIGTGAMIFLAGGGAGAATHAAISHEAPPQPHSVEKSHDAVPQAPQAAEKATPYEGIDDKRLVAAEHAEEREELDTAAKQEALSVMEELKDPSLGAEQNSYGTGVQNKGSLLEDRVSGDTKAAFANYHAETSTLSVSDFGEKGSSSVVFNIPPEVVADLNAEHQRDGKVDIDDLEKAVQNPNTHVNHFGAVEGKWDAANNRGASVNVSGSGEIRVSTSEEGYSYDGFDSYAPDKYASPTDVDNIIALAQKVNQNKAS